MSNLNSVTLVDPILAKAEFTIDASSTTGSAVDLGGNTAVALEFPATFTSTSVSFTVSSSLGGTYTPLYTSAGALISITCAAATTVALDPTDFLGVRFVKLVSGSTEGAARIVNIICKPV